MMNEANKFDPSVWTPIDIPWDKDQAIVIMWSDGDILPLNCVEDGEKIEHDHYMMMNNVFTVGLGSTINPKCWRPMTVEEIEEQQNTIDYEPYDPKHYALRMQWIVDKLQFLKESADRFVKELEDPNTMDLEATAMILQRVRMAEQTLEEMKTRFPDFYGGNDE